MSKPEKFKPIAVGTSFSEEPGTEFFFVVKAEADIARISYDEKYCLEMVICQTETMEWCERIAAALNRG